MPKYRSIYPAVLGPWVSSPAFFGLGNAETSSGMATQYALIQSTAGITFLNSSTNMFIRLQNASIINISTTGLSLNNAGNAANSILDVAGSIGAGSVFVTTASMTLNDTHHTVLSNSTVAAISVTVPAAGGSMARREHIVKKIDATTLALTLLAPTTASLIDGSTIHTVTAQNAGWHIKASSATLSSTNNWWIIGRCSTL